MQINIHERLYVKYSAKNSYGAYVSGEFDCPIKDGKVDRVRTVIEGSERALEAVKKQRGQ
jgi:hypothetical protein